LSTRQNGVLMKLTHDSIRAIAPVARDVVAIVGAAEAEKMARDAGASEARIAAAIRCLKP
jgi:hypothetical protein